MDNRDLLDIFGFTDKSSITAEDRKLHHPDSLFTKKLYYRDDKPHYSLEITSSNYSLTVLYATYLNIGVDGLQALEHYNPQNQAWGQVHHQVRPPASFSPPWSLILTQAHFSILKHLLEDGDGVISIARDLAHQSLTVHVDQSKISSHGKPSLGRYLCKLHIWRCTADVSACRKFYEPMCAVDDVYEEWRKIIVSKPKMRWKFVQPNTFLKGENVEIKVYEESNEGIIQSWVERNV